MTHDLQEVFKLFRINTRFVPRTTSEVASRCGMSNETASAAIRTLTMRGLLTCVSSDDGIYRLTNEGKQELDRMPISRGRVLTAVLK